MPETLVRPDVDPLKPLEPSIDQTGDGQPSADPVGDTLAQPTIPGDQAPTTPLEPQVPTDPVARARAEAQAKTKAARDERDATAERTRRRDRELLNGSARVEMNIRDAGNRGIRFWQGAWAKARNILAEPEKFIKTWAHNRAKNSFDRKQARLESARAAGNTHLADKILQPKVAAAEAKMKQRETALYDHKLEMDRRRDGVKQKAHERRETYMSTIRSKHEEKAGRRALKSELRAKGYTWSEARQTLGELPHEARQEIGRLAVVAFASERHANRAQGAENSANNRIVRNNLRRERAGASAAKHSDLAEQARQAAATMRSDLIPRLEEKLDMLRQEFAALTPEDAEYKSKHQEMTEAFTQLSGYYDQARHQEKAAASHNNKSTRKTRLSESLQSRGGDLQGGLAIAQKAVGAGRKTQANDRARLNETINNVINNKPTEAPKVAEKPSTEPEPAKERTEEGSLYAKLHGERAYALKYELVPAANAKFSELSQSLRTADPSNATGYQELRGQTIAAREAAKKLQEELDTLEGSTKQLT